MHREGRNTPGQWEDLKPGTYTYGELLKMTLALGRLAAKVTQPGEHVGVLLPNMAATVALMIGLSAYGRVPCMLNYTAGAEGMESACRTVGIRHVFTSRLFLQKAGLEQQAAGLTSKELIYLEDLRPQFNLKDKLWLLGYALWFPEQAVPAKDPAAPAVVLFTSGSEGKPKGVVLSHRALLANVWQIQQFMAFSRADVVFNCLPIFHSFGLTAGTLLGMVTGARIFFYPSPLHFKEIPRLIGEKGATLLFGTSTFLMNYARYATPEDLHTLRLVVAGAEKLTDVTRRTWKEKFGIDIYEGYGATETAPVLSCNVPDSNRPGTVGRLVPGIEARLVPVEGIERGGELHVRCPNLLSGYYYPERPGILEPPHSSIGAGWYNTGDIVDIDADDFLSIQGRLKRFAKVAGEMVSLEVAEILAHNVSAEAAHAATCVVDEGRGEAIVLFTTDSELTRDQLSAAARGMGYPEVAVPRRIRVVEAMPLLGSGKIDYHHLKDLAITHWFHAEQKPQGKEP
jgi:acyl-[acyl-carrier-protein]-phospholipid O-acyltransferase/long-chain-fatty-acid--[acyl-carrier-protein] ligase